MVAVAVGETAYPEAYPAAYPEANPVAYPEANPAAYPAAYEKSTYEYVSFLPLFTKFTLRKIKSSIHRLLSPTAIRMLSRMRLPTTTTLTPRVETTMSSPVPTAWHSLMAALKSLRTKPIATGMLLTSSISAKLNIPNTVQWLILHPTRPPLTPPKTQSLLTKRNFHLIVFCILVCKLIQARLTRNHIKYMYAI